MFVRKGLVASLSIAWTMSAFAEGGCPTDPYPCSGAVWYSSPNGVPGTRDGLTHPGDGDQVPVLSNGSYVGITYTWPLAGLTYQALDSYGVASSVMTQNLSNNQLVGAMYDYSTVATPVVSSGQFHQYVFPNYTVSAGQTISSQLSQGLNHFSDTTVVNGSSGFTLTVSMDDLSPYTLHVHFVNSAGIATDFDVTAANPYSGTYNLSSNNGVVSLTGVAMHNDNGTYAWTSIAVDFGINGSGFGESYIISHDIDRSNGQNFWRLNKAVRR